jgi:hypothetical protein
MLANEHRPARTDFLTIVRESSIVPPDNAYLFALPSSRTRRRRWSPAWDYDRATAVVNRPGDKCRRGSESWILVLRGSGTNAPVCVPGQMRVAPGDCHRAPPSGKSQRTVTLMGLDSVEPLALVNTAVRLCLP